MIYIPMIYTPPLANVLFKMLERVPLLSPLPSSSGVKEDILL